MATGFPAALDTVTILPTAATLAAEQLSTGPHSTLHGDIGLAVIAVETKVGITSSADTTSLDYKASRAIPFGALAAQVFG